MQDIIEFNRPAGFARDITCDRKRERILISPSGHNAILDIDYDGNVRAAYFPEDVLEKDSVEFEGQNVIKSKITPYTFYFEYSSEYDFGIITHPSGTLYKVKLLQ